LAGFERGLAGVVQFVKFIIVQGNRKRELFGPFSIIASRYDMENLRDQINGWLADEGNGCGISYGYLFVQERILEMGPQGPPEPWDDKR
jgi:hypothetical protein